MPREFRQSFVLSLLIHGGFVAVAVLFLFMDNWFKRPQPVVFELVQPAAAAPAQPENQHANEEPPTPVQPLRVPQAQPIRPLPDIPKLPEPTPPEPTPAPTPKPTPAPTPKPTPKPVEKPPEPVRTMSIDEFRRNRDVPDRVQTVTQQRPRPAPDIPDIQTNVRSRLERQIAEIRLQGAAIGDVQSTDALQRYLAELRRRLQDNFQPSGSNLEAEVYFTVTGGGRLTNGRIYRSSGNPAFDQSVLRVLQVTAPPGPPPGGRDYPFSLVFRSE